MGYILALFIIAQNLSNNINSVIGFSDFTG